MIFKFLEPSGPVQASLGIALPLLVLQHVGVVARYCEMSVMEM